jgi:hypothetical protein
MYYICVPGLGYVHKQWQADEPRFCADLAKAKSWKQATTALKFSTQNLANRVHVRWELWQDTEGGLIPIIRPQANRS